MLKKFLLKRFELKFHIFPTTHICFHFFFTFTFVGDFASPTLRIFGRSLSLIISILIVSILKMGKVCFSGATMTGQDGGGNRSIHPLKWTFCHQFHLFSFQNVFQEYQNVSVADILLLEFSFSFVPIFYICVRCNSDD